MNNFKILLKYLFKHKVLLFTSLIFSIIFCVSSLGIPYFSGVMLNYTKELISSYLVADQENISIIWDLFAKNFQFILFLIGICTIFQYFFQVISSNLSEKITNDLRKEVFEKINKISISNVDKISTGKLIFYNVNDIDNIGVGLVSSLKQFYQGIVMIISTIIIMYVINWILATIVFILTPLSFLLTFLIAKRTRKYFGKQNEINANLTSLLTENVQNLNVIHSFNEEENNIKKFEEINEELNKVGQKSQFLGALTNPTSRLINNTVYVFVGVCASFLCAFTNEPHIIYGAICNVGIIYTFLQYASQFSKPFNEINSCFGEIQQMFSSLERINQFLSLPNDFETGEEKMLENVENIKLSDVEFSYDDTRKILDGVNFEVKQGEKVAIVGPTGCGKTTLINILLRFYDTNNGAIYFDNFDIKNFKKEELRTKFGVVLQDTWIFKGTILENIKFGKEDATFEEVVQASKDANCYNFIMRLSDGFDTVINDESSLSNGQKQLICIARVMLSNPEIMILDEATSNIDTRSEIKIVNCFEKMTQNKTSFMIAHRLSTIINSDKIIVLKDGKVEEIGKHEELLSKKGFYYKLYTSEFSIKY